MATEPETPDDGVERPPLTYEEIRRRLEGISRDELTLAEMQRTGFWPKDQAEPNLPAEVTGKIGTLQREMAALRTERSRIADRERLLAAYRKQRLLESREKQKETKARRERERQAKAAAWQERKKREILYLGEGVSAGLNQKENRSERLAQRGLPAIGSALELAKLMGIELGELRFLSFHREASKINHYRRFEIPKKRGGKRLISAPMPRLKKAQRFILQNLLDKVAVEEPAQGFRAQRSIKTNAAPHVGQAVVINFDLENFFPTLTFERVKGLFHQLGYSEEVATILALLTTEPEIDQVELDGESWYLHRGPRRLPQGSPASPAITNLICRRLDRRLAGLAKHLGFTYTRYADDLTFSAAKKENAAIYQLLRRVQNIVEHEDFKLHPAKTRVMHRGRRQEVTGLTVNQKMAVEKKSLKRFRALLFQIEKDGSLGKRWNGVEAAKGGEFWSSILGWAHFVKMVDPEKGAPLVAKVRELLAKSGEKLPKRKVYLKKKPAVEATTEAQQGKSRWWQKLMFWRKDGP